MNTILNMHNESYNILEYSMSTVNVSSDKTHVYLSHQGVDPYPLKCEKRI
jgi:hypothetical protein